MEKDIYNIIKRISWCGGLINDEDYIIIIEKKYWDNVRDNRESSNYIKLLNEEFYNNCIKVLKKLKISKFDIKKYEALTTMIDALEKVKAENQKITEEELNELKEGAKKLINKLKTKYNEILEEKFTKNSRIAKLLYHTENLEDIYENFSTQEKETVSFIDFSNTDDEKLTEIIRNDLDFNKVKKLCQNEEERKNTELLENIKEDIIDKIKLTAKKLNHSYREFIISFERKNKKVNIKSQDFIQISNEKRKKELLPDEIVNILELSNGDCIFNSIIYKYSKELIYILSIYLNMEYDTFHDDFKDIYEKDFYGLSCNEKDNSHNLIRNLGVLNGKVLRR